MCFSNFSKYHLFLLGHLLFTFFLACDVAFTEYVNIVVYNKKINKYRGSCCI